MTCTKALWTEGSLTFSMFISELESLDKSEGLINRSADRKVVHGDLAHDSLIVNNEQTSAKNKTILEVTHH